MSIEIQRKKSEFIFRINPYNPRVIDRRVNRHGGRWQFYGQRASAIDAIKYLLELEKEDRERSSKNG